jgi:Glycosyl transferase family 8
MLHRGVIYCATTHDHYLESALISAIALRQLEPTLPITVISDRPLLNQFPVSDYGITPRFVSPEELGALGSFSSRSIKTQLLSFSPYLETLFLDADIIPIKSVNHLWKYLSQGDMAMVSDRNPTLALCDHIAQDEKDYTLNLLPGNTPQFNSGVMLWRNTRSTQALFQQWHHEWQQFHQQDQLALMRAIATTLIKVVPLPVTYNISPIDAAPVLLRNDEVYLLHCWGGVVSAGKFPAFAQEFYPDVVKQVRIKLVSQMLD